MCETGRGSVPLEMRAIPKAPHYPAAESCAEKTPEKKIGMRTDGFPQNYGGVPTPPWTAPWGLVMYARLQAARPPGNKWASWRAHGRVGRVWCGWAAGPPQLQAHWAVHMSRPSVYVVVTMVQFGSIHMSTHLSGLSIHYGHNAVPQAACRF